MAMERVSAVKHTFTVEDAYQRAAQTLEGCIKFGATRMRPHVELDGGVELRTFEAVSALQRDYAWAIDIELCVFPQEGLTNNPRADELLVEALKRGARVIGAAPNFDPDHAGQIHRVFDLAREYDVDIDMHLDSGNSPDDMDIASRLRADRAIQTRRARRDRARLQIFDDEGGRRSTRWRRASPMPASRSPRCRRPICSCRAAIRPTMSAAAWST